jgi:hypothetical protein
MPIVTQTEVGHHNADLSQAAGRVMQGGSWKKQRVVVVLPAAQQIPSVVALSHWNLIFPPNQAVYRILALGMEVGDAYSQTIDAVLSHPELSTWEYVLTIEADNAPPPDGLVKLLERMEAHPELSAISGLYWCKGPGGAPHIWGDLRDPVVNYRPQVPVPGQLVECCGLSMGFTLYRMAMFRDLAPKIEKPWFKTKASREEGCGTQDLHFWANARKFGHRCAVDCAVTVGHYDQAGTFGVPDKMW